MICDFSGTAMKLLMFEMNHHTRPVTVIVTGRYLPGNRKKAAAGGRAGGIGKAEDG